MTIGAAFAHFFAGALLANALPHLVAGVQGMPFQSPFAKPSGVGESSPIVNVLWGAANALGGAHLLIAFPLDGEFTLSTALFVLGALALALFGAAHFGKVRRTRTSERSD